MLHAIVSANFSVGDTIMACPLNIVLLEKSKNGKDWQILVEFKGGPCNTSIKINGKEYKQWVWQTVCGYLPSSNVTVNSLLEQVSGLLEEEALLEGHRLTTKAGCLGVGSVAVSLPSMKTTLDMVGRSLGSSCTHKSPTVMHFRYSSFLQLSLSVSSIKSNALSSFHKCHAWKQFWFWR